MAEGYQREIGLLPSQAIDTTRLIGGPAIVTRFALRKLRPPRSPGAAGQVTRSTGCPVFAISAST